MAEHGAVKFGDDASPWVAIGKRLGAESGDVAGDAFRDHMEEGAVRFGDDGAPFVKTGRRLGGEGGEAAGREFADRMEQGAVRFGDDGNPFVEVGRKHGKEGGEAAGEAFNKGFNRKASQGARDHGRRTGKEFGDGVNDGLSDSLKNIAPAFASIASAMGKVLGTGSLWGGIAAGVAGLGAAAASSAGYVVTLAADLAPLNGLLAGLPGIALVGAAAFTTWKLATGGLGEAMGAAFAEDDKAYDAALGKLTESGRAFAAEFRAAVPALKDFKAAAQDAFTGQLAGSLSGFISALDGLKPSMSGLATEFGSITRGVLEFVTAADSIGQFNRIFGDTRSLVGAVKDALQPLLQGFTDLGVVGSSWLGGVAGPLRDMLTTFGQWMSQISASGQALAWLNDATAVLKTLGGLVKDVWQIFTGLLKAAETAGAGALGVLSQLVDTFNVWVNSAHGQETLVTIFRALNDVGRALLPVITALGDAVAAIAPEAAKVALALGPVLGDAIRVLGAGIAALGPGLVKMVEGIGRAIDAIDLAPLGAALGDVFAALGDALALIIPQLAEIATALAPALAAAVRALGPALASLGPGLTAIAQQLAIAFASPEMQRGLLALGEGLAHLLVAAAPLLPMIGQLAGILAQVLGGALSNLGLLLQPIVEALGRALEPALRAISDALAVLVPLMPPIYQAFGEIGAALITQLLPPILDLIPALINAVIPAFAELARQLQPLIPLLADLAVQLLQQVLPAILPILPQLTELSLALARMGLVLGQLVADMAPYIQQIIGIFQYLYDVLVGHSIIPDLINAMTTWFRNGVQWIKDIVSWFGELPGMISRWLQDVLGRVQDAWSNIRNTIANQVSGAQQAISSTLSNISGIWSNAWSNAQAYVSTAWSNIRSAVSSGASSMLGVVASIPGQVVGALGNLGSLLYGSGQSLMSGFINGLYSMLQGAYNAAADILGRIRNLFPFSPAREGPFSGKGWTLYSGQSLIQGLAEGALQEQGTLTSALDQVMRAGADALVPALPAFAGPSPAPTFDGTFGAASGGGGTAVVAGQRTIVIETLNVRGVFDPTNPVSYRRMVEQLREAIRELEKEEYANG
ncbi:hypothetical protein AB0L05_27650 [Nonomuraea pusilla]